MKKEKKQYNPIWLKQENFWYNLWKAVKSPWRPAKEDIKFYEKIVKKVVKKNKNPKVLVLGSTPEIRDMLAKYKTIEVTLIDLNIPVSRAMTRLMKRKNPREKLIPGNWLKMDQLFPRNYFDIVIGHGNFENIKIEKHDLFYKNIKHLVKKNGYVIMARGCLDSCLKNPITFKQVVEKYKKNPKYFKNFVNRIFMLYRLADEPGVYDHKAQGLKFHILLKKLIQEAKKQGLSDKAVKDLCWTPGLGADTYYIEVDIATEKKLKSMLQKHFKIISLHHLKYHPVAEPAANFVYNFILKPKK